MKSAGQVDPQMWHRGAGVAAHCQQIAGSGYEIIDLPGRVVDCGPRAAFARQRDQAS